VCPMQGKSAYPVVMKVVTLDHCDGSTRRGQVMSILVIANGLTELGHVVDRANNQQVIGAVRCQES